jgi:hypothetical protein
MEEKISLQFTQEELKVLSAALIEAPYKVVASLIANINQQIHQAQKGKEVT